MVSPGIDLSHIDLSSSSSSASMPSIGDPLHLYLITIGACLTVGLFSMLSLFIFSILINHQPNPFRTKSNQDKSSSSLAFVFDPNKSELLKTILSFAVGGLLGDVFLHLLPEAGVQLDRFGYSVREAQHYLGGWILTGVILFTTIESVFVQLHQIFITSKEECKTLEDNNSNSRSISNGTLNNSSKSLSSETTTRQRTNNSHKTVPSSSSSSKEQISCSNSQSSSSGPATINVTGYLNLLANSFDNFTHGMAVGASFLVSYKTGVLTTLAIAIHEMPHEIADYVILVRSGFSSWDALRAQLSISLVTMVGALSVLYFDSGDSAAAAASLGAGGGASLNYTLWILPFTAGGFIYIALTSLLPELLQLDPVEPEDPKNHHKGHARPLSSSRFHNIQCLIRRLALTVGGIFIMAAVNMIDLF